MQPMNRPPGPPYDPRTMGPGPAGPPQMQRGLGFRPQLQPGMPAPIPFSHPPSGPPIQKMANMSLGPQMPLSQESPNPSQMNLVSNGVTNVGTGHIQQNLPANNDPNITKQEQPTSDFKASGHSDFLDVAPKKVEEQQMQGFSPAVSHAEMQANNYHTERVLRPQQAMTAGQPPQMESSQQAMTAGQPQQMESSQQTHSMASQSSTNMPFQSSSASPMSSAGMTAHHSGSMSPHMPEMQAQSASGMTQRPNMIQPPRPSMPQTIMPGMPQRSEQSISQGQGSGIPQQFRPGMRSRFEASAPQQLGPRSPQQLGPSTPQQLGPSTPQQLGPSTPQQLGQSTPQQLGPGMPQLSGRPIGGQPGQSHFPDPRTPYQPGMPPQPSLSSQQSGPRISHQPGMPPQPSGLVMTPQMPSQNFQPPPLSNQTRSPLTPSMATGGGYDMPAGGIRNEPSRMTPTQSYPPSSGFSAFQGQPGAPPTSGIIPRMPPVPGMQPRMPPTPGSIQSPMVPPAPSTMPHGMHPQNAGQQQYMAQQGGMQNRYPGASPQAPGMSGYSQGQGRKLNPDDMPSPLQVIEEDIQSRSGEFITNVKGTLPPLVTTNFHVTDGGNASPRFIRSTMYSIPATPDLMKQAAVPFGLVISPMAGIHPREAPLYLGTSLSTGPVRCNRCKAYMSTLMMFMDGGRSFQCLLCKQRNEVPSDYYCHMDSQGARADKFQRPELCLGAFEYVATPEYCRDKLLPKEPAFIFVLELTQMMLQRGVISLVCQNMKEILKNLPVDEVPGQENTKSKIHVGFITYDSSVHFYKLSGLSPEMCVICDKEGMFVPVPDGILCEPEQVAHNIDKLMESIPREFQTARETSGNLYGAINAGMAALKASGRSGKLFVFHSSLPHGEGVGKVRNRDDRKVLATDKEKSVLAPQNAHYNNLAQDLVTAGCGVDLYLFNESYIDLATLGQLAKITGGQCYKYTYFTLNKDGPRLLEDLKINVARNIAFEAVMRVRSSTGVRPVEFYGHFFMSNTHDIELAVVDSSKCVVVEVKHDDKISEEDGVYVQTALLYTSCGGQRRLRILNLSFNVCSQMADLFKSCDNDTLMNFLAKEAMFKFLQTSAKQIKENLISRSAHILSCYRKNCASPSSVGQLILPELLKLLPLYVNCLSKSDALSGGQDLTCDDRSWHIYQLCTMDVAASAVYLYPRLIPLSDADPQDTTVPSPLRTSYDKLRPDGAFLLENGLFMFIWVGSGISTTWINDVFGVAAPHHLDPVLSELPDLDNPISKRVRGILDSIRKERGTHLRLFVVPQQGKHELVLRNYLVEDKGTMGSPSYVEFLCHIHKEVRAVLS